MLFEGNCNSTVVENTDSCSQNQSYISKFLFRKKRKLIKVRVEFFCLVFVGYGDVYINDPRLRKTHRVVYVYVYSMYMYVQYTCFFIGACNY